MSIMLEPTTLGLIYVNPQAPLANSDPLGTGVNIKAFFGRMVLSMEDSVSLIGCGHAFGLCHGAGLNPSCGKGTLTCSGSNTFTSGMEGA